MPKPDSCCSACGQPFPENTGWPRTCAFCNTTFWKNPIPVTVMVVPVKEGERTGVLVIRRGIEPKKGLLALPGGFVNHGESWQQGGAREVLEETGLVLKAEQITLLDVHSAPPGPRSSNLLIFGLHPEIPAETLPVFEPTDETEELCVLFEAVELAFPLHSLMLKRFFDSR